MREMTLAGSLGVGWALCPEKSKLQLGNVLFLESFLFPIGMWQLDVCRDGSHYSSELH